MSTERFRFKKFHIDYTWKFNFSKEALNYLCQNKEWLYERLNEAVNKEPDNKVGIDFIIILDSGDILEEQKFVTVRTVIVCSKFSWYQGYDNMFFSGDLKRSAVQNLQSNNEPLKEISLAIVKGDGAIYDDSILFPYTTECYNNLHENYSS